MFLHLVYDDLRQLVVTNLGYDVVHRTVLQGGEVLLLSSGDVVDHVRIIFCRIHSHDVYACMHHHLDVVDVS